MVAIDPSLLLRAAAGFQALSTIAFEGGAGQAVDLAQWNIITGVHYNNELQDYTTSTENIQLSGNGTILIIPRKSASGQWTSGRIESKTTFTPEDKKVTRFESSLRFGDSPVDKQRGIWPAFWMLGDSSRQGTPWPECGELDIMERINGEDSGHGTPHCGSNDECGAFTKTVPLPDNGYHTWAIEVDRTNADWKAQTITWLMDENKYNTITGTDLKEEAIWKSVAHSPLYFILNVAVGGNWPGPPNDATTDGLSNMMEVKSILVSSK